LNTFDWKLELVLDKYTKSLLHFDGANGSTVFHDDKCRYWTAHGGAQLSTAQYKFGASAIYFDGVGDYVSTPNSADFDLGTGDWTIDFWARRIGDLDNYNGWISAAESGQTGWTICSGTGATINKVRLVSKASGSWVADIESSSALVDLTWTHVAVVRYGNTVTLYLDGVSKGTVDATGYTYNSAGTGMVLGRRFTDEDDHYLKGRIDELRISKGIARWTAAFTPPTAAYNIWTDVTADVSLMDGPIEITDGIQSTSLVDLLANPGALSFVLDNSPANSAGLGGYYSPNHSNCRAGFEKNIMVRYSENYTAAPAPPTWYTQGVYWLQKPIPSAGVFGEAITRCRATDWLELMMNVPLPAIGVATSQTGDQLISTLLAAVATQPENTNLMTGDNTFASAFDADDVQRDSVYSILGKIARSEYGRIYMQPSTSGGGVLTFENRNYRAGVTAALGNISNTMDDAIAIDDAGMVYDRFQVTITTKRVDTDLVTVATLDYHLYLSAGEERSFTLNYVEQTSGNRISGTNIQTPVVSTDYKFGTLDDGTTEDLNGDLVVTQVRTGANSSDLKVKNNGASNGYLNLFKLRGYGIYAYNPYTVEQGTGGLRVLTLDMPYQTNGNVADSVCTSLQVTAADNNRRACRVTIHANKSADLMTAAMTGLISTRWTVIETQTGLSGDYFINGRKRTVEMGNKLTVEWILVLASNVSAWILETSALDTNTILAI
jgi:hypothetical protein